MPRRVHEWRTSPAFWKLAALIARLAAKDGQCTAGVRYLAAESGLSAPTVVKGKRLGAAMGLWRIEHQPGHGTGREPDGIIPLRSPFWGCFTGKLSRGADSTFCTQLPTKTTGSSAVSEALLQTRKRVNQIQQYASVVRSVEPTKAERETEESTKAKAKAPDPTQNPSPETLARVDEFQAEQIRENARNPAEAIRLGFHQVLWLLYLCTMHCLDPKRFIPWCREHGQRPDKFNSPVAAIRFLFETFHVQEMRRLAALPKIQGDGFVLFRESSPPAPAHPPAQRIEPGDGPASPPPAQTRQRETCSTCHGDGKAFQGSLTFCPVCKGTGLSCCICHGAGCRVCEVPKKPKLPPGQRYSDGRDPYGWWRPNW